VIASRLFPPGVERVEPLIFLPNGLKILAMHIEANCAAIHGRCPPAV
jgi:hypothetical protein